MQNANEIQKDIDYILGVKKQLLPITLEDIEEHSRNLNPKEGFTTDEIKRLMFALLQYDTLRKEIEKRIDIFPGVVKFFGPISNPNIRLTNEIKAIKKLILLFNEKIYNLNCVISSNLRRITNINVNIYLQNVVEDSGLYNEKTVMLLVYKEAIDKYQKAINTLSQRIEAHKSNITNTTENDLAAITKMFIELQKVKEAALKQQTMYHYSLETEANNFVLYQYADSLENLEDEEIYDISDSQSDNLEVKEKNEAHAAEFVWDKSVQTAKATAAATATEIETETTATTTAVTNSQWLKDLIEAYKDEFNKRENEKTLNLKIPEEMKLATEQLKAFIRHVLNNPGQYDIKVRKIVHEVLLKMGDDIKNLDPAFNTDENKKYGLLKSPFSQMLLKELEDFISKKMGQHSPKVLNA